MKKPIELSKYLPFLVQGMRCSSSENYVLDILGKWFKNVNIILIEYAPISFEDIFNNELSEFLELDAIDSMRKTIDDYCDTEFRRCFEFYLNTGARRSVILYIMRDHIDYDKQRITLVKTKTGKPRYIPIDDVFNGIIQNMPENDERLFNYYPDTLTHKQYFGKFNISLNFYA